MGYKAKAMVGGASEAILVFLKLQQIVAGLQKLGLKELEARVLIMAFHATDFMIIPFTIKNVRDWLGYGRKIFDIAERLEEVMDSLCGQGLLHSEELQHTTCYHITPKGSKLMAEIFAMVSTVVVEAHRPVRSRR